MHICISVSLLDITFISMHTFLSSLRLLYLTTSLYNQFIDAQFVRITECWNRTRYI